MKTRIMYIECRSDGHAPARIGRVRFSKSGRSVHYDNRTFRSLGGQGFKANYIDVDSHDEYWISGCKKDGSDALYSTLVAIDEDVREEYWISVRNLPELKERKSFKFPGKYPK